MTSDGQQAGRQPGATSGGGAEPFGAEGFPPDAFPPDSGGSAPSERGPSYPHAQDSFPSAYAPPPHSTPNGGSPFVVPAVPPSGQPAGRPGPAFGPAAAQFSSAGSARVPGSQDAPAHGSARPPVAGEGSPFGQQASGNEGAPFGQQAPANDGSVFGQPPAREGSPFGQPAGEGSPFSQPAPGESFGQPPHASGQARASVPPPRDGGHQQSAGQPSAASSHGGGQPPLGGGQPPYGAAQPQAPGENGLAQRTPAQAVRAAAQPPHVPDQSHTSQAPLAARQPQAAQSPLPGREPQSPLAQTPLAQSPLVAREPQVPQSPLPAREQAAEPSLPSRQPQDSSAHSMWAPPPSAPASADQRNPFESQEFRQGQGGQLPQRSPGVAGGPLAGPVGEFNGFTPTRSTPGQSDGPRRTGGPFDREPGEQQSSGRPPGLSAFGDQRVRVPGATLTDLPDGPASPQDGGLPVRGGSSDSGGFPVRGQAPEGASFPLRGSSSGESGAMSASEFRAQSQDPAASRQSDPFAQPGAGAQPFGPAGAGSQPFGQSDAGSQPFGQAESGSQPFGQGEAGSQPFGQSDAGSQPFGQGEVGSQSFGQPAGFGRPDAEPSPFGRPSAGTPDPEPFARQDPEPFTRRDDGPFGQGGAGEFGNATESPFGRTDGSRDEGDRPAGYPQRVPGASFSAPDAGRPPVPDSAPPATSDDRAGSSGSGYPQRVPGASFASGGAPVVAEARSAASVPQPRDSAEGGEQPESSGVAKGSARPVSASASVPVASRVAPVDGDELPPPSPAPQSRVYGRAAPATEQDDESRDSDAPANPYAPERPFGARPGGDASDEDRMFGPRPTSGAAEASADAPPFGTRPSSGSPAGGMPGDGGPAGGGFGPGDGRPASGAVAASSLFGPGGPGPRPTSGGFGADDDRRGGFGNDSDPRGGGFGTDNDPRGGFGNDSDPRGGSFGDDSDERDRFRDERRSERGNERGNEQGGDRSGDSQRSFGVAEDAPRGAVFGAPVSDPEPGAFDDQPAPDRFGPPPNRPGTYGTPSSGTPFSAPPAEGGPAPTSGVPQAPRAAGRATASARVSPPGQPFAPAPGSPAPGQAAGPGAPISGSAAPHSPAPGFGQSQDGPDASAFSEYTSDLAGRGRPGQPAHPGPVPGNPASRTTPPDYSEHTTDVSGRGQGPAEPYVPAPALPAMHATPPRENGFPPAADSTQPFGERPRMGGTFPGPTNRATVTPPSDQTASWPSADDHDQDQDRFNSFQPEGATAMQPVVQPSGEVAKSETPHVRMLPVLLGVILGAGLLVGLTFGITWLIARGSDTGGFSVSTGDCVKREGNEAVTAKCGDAGTFEVTNIVDTKEQCPDPAQPYVLNPTGDNKTQVLCLKPRG